MRGIGPSGVPQKLISDSALAQTSIQEQRPPQHRSSKEVQIAARDVTDEGNVACSWGWMSTRKRSTSRSPSPRMNPCVVSCARGKTRSASPRKPSIVKGLPAPPGSTLSGTRRMDAPLSPLARRSQFPPPSAAHRPAGAPRHDRRNRTQGRAAHRPAPAAHARLALGADGGGAAGAARCLVCHGGGPRRRSRRHSTVTHPRELMACLGLVPSAYARYVRA